MDIIRERKGQELLSVIILVPALAAWLTHIFVCISNYRLGLLLAGFFVFPVGVIHGIGVWFGVW